MDEGGSGRGGVLRVSAISAAVVLGMFAAYQLGMAGGSVLMLVVPVVLAVFVIGTLAALVPDRDRHTPADAIGWERFDLELERSRRHERPLALLRISVSTGPRARRWAPPDSAEIRDAVRVLDAVWVDREHVFVLMPETNREALSRAIGRILTRLPRIDLEAMRVALYPEDGLTSGALISRLEAPEAEPQAVEVVHLPRVEDGDDEAQDRTG
jgi:hypothetical protein